LSAAPVTVVYGTDEAAEMYRNLCIDCLTVEIKNLPSFVLQLERKLHLECERLKATERAPWTTDARACNQEAAMAAFTWPRLGAGLRFCFPPAAR
jgi:hypothetical protein